jgi:tetratricopeptide (TPR) repeat protein
MTNPTALYSADALFAFEPVVFQEKVERHAEAAALEFQKITRFYALFHVAFFTLGAVELLSFFLFFSFFAKSSLLAFALAAIFLTSFSYCVLLFYFQAKKPEQFFGLRQSFLDNCKEGLPFKEGKTEYHHAMTDVALKFAHRLDHLEATYYHLPKHFETLSPLMEKFSRWSHWKDVHKMKELLLFTSIEEQIQIVKSSPCDLQAHAGLANAYVALSEHYMDPRKKQPDISILWVSSAYDSQEMQDKFKMAADRAIEEFQILRDYAPADRWVHAQLATLYHHLGMRDKETAEYETLLAATPQDPDLLFHVGVLYFEQGFNGKGLRVYEQLTQMNHPKAQELISFYDAFLPWQG